MAKKKSTKRPVKKVAKQSKKKVAQKKSARTKSNTNPLSVDSILLKFEKERLSKETQLVSIRKKIAELTAKTKAFQEQIVQLSEQEVATVNAIETIGSRRDVEVTETLAKLGIQLTTPTTTHTDESNSGVSSQESGELNTPATNNEVQSPSSESDSPAVK